MALEYLDSGVLIAAARRHAAGHQQALDLLAGPDAFASSDLVRLEILPKAVFHGHRAEQHFYEAFFASTAAWAALDQELCGSALQVAQQFGLAAVDALHVAAAMRLGVDSLVTTERAESPLMRVTTIAVRALVAPVA